MQTTRINSENWKTYFDEINVELKKKQVFIEVASLAFGDQIESDWTQLNEISYDQRADLCGIEVPGIGHRIHKPQEVHVACGNLGIEAIEIKDKDGAKHIMRFREPLALPAPDSVDS